MLEAGSGERRGQKVAGSDLSRPLGTGVRNKGFSNWLEVLLSPTVKCVLTLMCIIRSCKPSQVWFDFIYFSALTDFNVPKQTLLCPAVEKSYNLSKAIEEF